MATSAQGPVKAPLTSRVELCTSSPLSNMCADFYSFQQLCPSAYTQALNKGKNPGVLVVPTFAGGPQIPEMEETSEAYVVQTLTPEKSTTLGLKQF